MANFVSSKHGLISSAAANEEHLASGISLQTGQIDSHMNVPVAVYTVLTKMNDAAYAGRLRPALGFACLTIHYAYPRH